jgi:proline iminopeptidase
VALRAKSLEIESPSGKLFAIINPRPKAESIMLLHGGPGLPTDFSPIAEHLSPKYQVIAFDQRGTRRSPLKKEDYSIEGYIKDIDVVCQQFGLDKFHLFGHSWGGLYAQIYSEKNPHRILSLFLASPSSGTGDVCRQTEKEILSYNRTHSSAWEWATMVIQSLLALLGSDAASKSLYKQVLENYNREFDSSFVASDAMVENVMAGPTIKTRFRIRKYPVLKEFVNCPFPVMITYGDKDIYGKSRQEVLRRFPEAIIKEFSNSGHFPWIHSPQEFNSSLAEFYRLQQKHCSSMA